jgi:hypothetical protein
MVGRDVTRPKGNGALNYFMLFHFFLLEINPNTLMIVEIRFHPKMGKPSWGLGHGGTPSWFHSFDLWWRNDKILKNYSRIWVHFWYFWKTLCE